MSSTYVIIVKITLSVGSSTCGLSSSTGIKPIIELCPLLWCCFSFVQVPCPRCLQKFFSFLFSKLRSSVQDFYWRLRKKKKNKRNSVGYFCDVLVLLWMECCEHYILLSPPPLVQLRLNVGCSWILFFFFLLLFSCPSHVVWQACWADSLVQDKIWSG